MHAIRLECMETSCIATRPCMGCGTTSSTLAPIPGEIVGPYENVRTKTRQLHNLHATIDSLRQVVHRIKLVQKLRIQLLTAPPPSSSSATAGGGLDLAKAAKLITDIRAVDAESDLKGIDVVEADDMFLQESVVMIRQQAEVRGAPGRWTRCMRVALFQGSHQILAFPQPHHRGRTWHLQVALVDGMESMSQAKVGSALQIFFNLDELPQVWTSFLRCGAVE